MPVLTGTCAGKGRAQIINRKINVKNRAAEAEQVEGRKKGGWLQAPLSQQLSC